MRSRYCRWGGFFTVVFAACAGREGVDRATWLRTHDAGQSLKPNPNPCLQSTPIFGDNSGYERCQSGMIHRVQRFACPSTVPRPDFNAPDGGLTEFECRKDDDCSALGVHSYCKFVAAHMGPPNSYVCVKGCVDDSECGAGEICVCDGVAGTCAPSNCSSDGACPPSFLCASLAIGCSGIPSQFACQSPDDKCGGNADCGPGHFCGRVPVGRGSQPPRSCEEITCVE